jgi:predicted TIM-barrel fold metal-dependent hydrolase
VGRRHPEFVSPADGRVSRTADGLIPGPLVDTHVHVVSADIERFPLGPTGLGRNWWHETGRDAEGLVSVMDDHGVGQALVTQAIGPYGYDNTYLLHAVSTHRDRLAAVPAVHVDDRTIDDDVMAASIAGLAASPGVVGVRLLGIAPGSSWAHDEARARIAFDAARRAGLVVVLTVWPDQLAALTNLIRETSDCPVALDHCGFPHLSGDRVPADAPLMALREDDNVRLKVTSHLLREAAVDGDPASLVAQLAAAFGAERLLWGSDYPQTDGAYDALLRDAAAAAGGVEAGARPGFFAGNASRTFFGGSPSVSHTSARGNR